MRFLVLVADTRFHPHSGQCSFAFFSHLHLRCVRAMPPRQEQVQHHATGDRRYPHERFYGALHGCQPGKSQRAEDKKAWDEGIARNWDPRGPFTPTQDK